MNPETQAAIDRIKAEAKSHTEDYVNGTAADFLAAFLSLPAEIVDKTLLAVLKKRPPGASLQLHRKAHLAAILDL